MNLYTTLKLKPTRTDPTVWVRRLVIFEKVSPEPTIIRDIALRRGLNIVWAEEPDHQSASAEIAGHSAGKTTFCRLLRYILGESTFGTGPNMAMIRETLPDAYVAAELFVKGKQWAALRPIGSGRASYTRAGVSVESLLRDKGPPLSHADYPSSLGLDQLTDSLQTAEVVRTGERIVWPHLLAWCSRDQETRFQNIYEWRSPRSESESPAFRFPRVGPLFVMRTALGLFLPEELVAEEKLAKLLQRKEELEREVEDRRREPQFRIRQYESELREALQEVMPEAASLTAAPIASNALEDDLLRLAEKAMSELRKATEALEAQRRTLQDQIDALGGESRELLSREQTLRAVFQLSVSAGQQLTIGQTELLKEQEDLKQHADKECPFGRILIKDCSYVDERRRTIYPELVKDAHAREQAEARQVDERERLNKELTKLTTERERVDGERLTLQSERDARILDARGRRELITRIDRLSQRLEEWVVKQHTPSDFAALSTAQGQLVTVTAEAEKLAMHLNSLLAKHAANRTLLSRIFSATVKSVLASGTYDGTVQFNDRELSFRITHGSAMSGEAVETLSVLLADLSSLVYHTVNENSQLPGILIHDSPREADLALRLYLAVIRLAQSLEEAFGSEDQCPFQYILTTTTAPPEELRGDPPVKLRLDAAKPESLLFKRSTAGPTTLFDALPG